MDRRGTGPQWQRDGVSPSRQQQQKAQQEQPPQPPSPIKSHARACLPNASEVLPCPHPSMAPSSAPSVPAELPRVLSTLHATSFVVGIIIGSGIFLVPREMTAAAGSSSRVYLAWIVGGLLSLAGAMTYAEIASAHPRYGGEYAFLREAYGDLTGFLYMWTWVLIAKPASLATIASGLIRVLGTFSVFAFFSTPAAGPVLWSQVVAIAVTWLITLLNIVSTLNSAHLQLVLTWLKLALIAAIAGACFFLAGPHGSLAHLRSSLPSHNSPVAGFMVALVAALWAYDGWSDVTQLAGEVRNPRRALPLALVGGVTVVGLLYMLTNAAIAYVLPALAIASTDRPAADALRLVTGPYASAIVSLGMALSIASTFIGSSLSGARVPFAAARDGLFPRMFAHVSSRFHTPSIALVLQATLATLLLLAVGRFQALFSLAIFAEWLFYALTASTVFVFRRREQKLSQLTNGDQPVANPYRTPLFPLTPVLFIAAATGLLVFSFYQEPRDSLLGSAVILLGIPVHLLLRRRNPAPVS